MKLLLKLFIGGVVLLTTGFAQEPKYAMAGPHEFVAPPAASSAQMVITGSPQRPAPVLQPKALPQLSPSLGEIARKIRAAHAAAPKAEVVVADETQPAPQQK